ncbi:hypothetical protein NP233_g8041 [Leucocoprinus birnbaumii]|uniref:PEBP-like protein n=1 Tax=Leucocoprinus birnbaumii TaxID=56174 RepID=A0AAD5YU34_9AGAR|nr:hypothetical protein NP233_g8041 [Leucocoprinus birnbaumii]
MFRMRALHASILAFATLTLAQDFNTKIVKDAFNKAHIPKDIGLNFNPTLLLEVSFPVKNRLPVTVHAGERVPINSTGGPPIFSLLSPSLGIGRHSKDANFVVVAIDPDAPTPQDPSAAQVRHFLGGDYWPFKLGPFDISTPLLVNTTSAVSEWLQPAPPEDSDPHRYIFLAFKQPDGFNKQTLVTPETDILNWDLKDFVDGVGLGDPIAGTYMLVSFSF